MKKAIVTFAVLTAASVAIATYSSRMLPKIAFAESTQAKEQPNDERAIRVEFRPVCRRYFDREFR